MNNKYDFIPAVRRSDLWELRKSPAHYKYRIDHPQEDTPALLFGRAAHKYILEPDDFWNAYSLAPDVDRRTKAGKAEYALFVETLGDKMPLSTADYATIEDMAAQIEAHPTARDILRHGIHETPIEWIDAITGERCKCRPDVLNTVEGYIADYKTTQSCEGGAFERACRYYGYKLQAAMYTEGVFAKSAMMWDFVFVAQEKAPPYAVRVYKCDPGFVEEGIEMFHELIALYHSCKESGEWPGYPDEVIYGE